MERLKTKYGLILLSAGSAIGLGNVWRFPFVVGKFGGAIFVIIYLVFLFAIGLPMLNAELSIGRYSRTAPVLALEKISKDKKWKKFGFISYFGAYILMFFYVVVAGWILNYIYKYISGQFKPDTAVPDLFTEMLANPLEMLIFTIIVVGISFFVLYIGFNKGVENISSKLMALLLLVIIVLAINSLTLKNSFEGVKFYLLPNFKAIKDIGLLRIIYEAMNQAFFTLSIGIGAIATFGAKSGNDKNLFSSSISIILLDTFVAIVSGLIIFPATTAFSIDQKAGPGLVFIVIPEVFKNIFMGRFWGGLFFVFLAFAAFTTIITAFELIVQNHIALYKGSRNRAIVINFIVVMLGSLPVILGYNVLSWINPLGLGSTILDLFDFIISANLLPLGALVYMIFIMKDSTWGYKSFLEEINKGKGIKLKVKISTYLKYILPIVVLLVYIAGLILKFVK